MWSSIYLPTDTGGIGHVVPTFEENQHQLEPFCKCKPIVEILPDNPPGHKHLVIHKYLKRDE